MGSLSNGMHFLENVRRGNVFFMSDRMWFMSKHHYFLRHLNVNTWYSEIPGSKCQQWFNLVAPIPGVGINGWANAWMNVSSGGISDFLPLYLTLLGTEVLHRQQTEEIPDRYAVWDFYVKTSHALSHARLDDPRVQQVWYPYHVNIHILEIADGWCEQNEWAGDGYTQVGIGSVAWWKRMMKLYNLPMDELPFRWPMETANG